MGKQDVTRRKFLEKASIGTAGLIVAPFLKNGFAIGETPATEKSRVVSVHDDGAIVGSTIDEEVVQVMVDAGIRSLTGIDDVGEAWKSLFPSIAQSSVIVIKVNCINDAMSSHPEVAYAIADGLTRMQVGGYAFPANNIILFDRTSGELRNGGYTTNTSGMGVRCFGTNQSGVGYDSTRYSVNGSSQRLSRILTDLGDYMINLAILKNHGTSGVTLSMKNHYGTCNAPGGLHGNHCDPYVPALNALSPIRDKQVLCMCDALFGIVSGGPGGPPQVMPKILVFGKDTVALDAVCTQILADHGCGTISRAHHVQTAANSPYNLGTDNPESIEHILVEQPTNRVENQNTENELPAGFHLYQNYPNPFNATTVIPYQIDTPGRVRMRVFDAKGGLVRRLIDRDQRIGEHRIVWDGLGEDDRPVPSGVYFVRLSHGRLSRTIRTQVLR